MRQIKSTTTKIINLFTDSALKLKSLIADASGNEIFLLIILAIIGATIYYGLRFFIGMRLGNKTDDDKNE